MSGEFSCNVISMTTFISISILFLSRNLKKYIKCSPGIRLTLSDFLFGSMEKKMEKKYAITNILSEADPFPSTWNIHPLSVCPLLFRIISPCSSPGDDIVQTWGCLYIIKKERVLSLFYSYLIMNEWMAEWMSELIRTQWNNVLSILPNFRNHISITFLV